MSNTVVIVIVLLISYIKCTEGFGRRSNTGSNTIYMPSNTSQYNVRNCKRFLIRNPLSPVCVNKLKVYCKNIYHYKRDKFYCDSFIKQYKLENI